MTTYITFQFYQDVFHGSSISLDDFDSLALRASAEIDRLTFGRAEVVVTAGTDTDTIQLIRLATCAVADELQKWDAVGVNGLVQSERVGQVAIAYAPGASNMETKISKHAKTYLWSTGLMYRGLDDVD